MTQQSVISCSLSMEVESHFDRMIEVAFRYPAGKVRAGLLWKDAVSAARAQ